MFIIITTALFSSGHLYVGKPLHHPGHPGHLPPLHHHIHHHHHHCHNNHSLKYFFVSLKYFFGKIKYFWLTQIFFGSLKNIFSVHANSFSVRPAVWRTCSPRCPPGSPTSPSTHWGSPARGCGGPDTHHMSCVNAMHWAKSMIICPSKKYP